MQALIEIAIVLGSMNLVLIAAVAMIILLCGMLWVADSVTRGKAKKKSGYRRHRQLEFTGWPGMR
jgi:hypothetical protein